ncbi:MAG TPA: ABC transporter ATP-binding protein, partial [Anaerolineae bacterium]|nr:ABC transporter ATP-binding protein [Anaerolineae bacterium]
MMGEMKGERLSTWRYWWLLIKCHPGLYGTTTLLRILIFAGIFQVEGLLIRALFEGLTDGAVMTWGPMTWVVLLIMTAVARNGFIMVDMYVFFAWVFNSGAVMRKNMFAYILSRPGARALPSSTGEAISRFRGDAEDVGQFTAEALFVVAQGIFAVTAFVIMLGIDVQITLFVFLPLTAVLIIAHRTRLLVEKYREDSRATTGNVTGFIGEMFSAVMAIKGGTAEERVLARFGELNEARRKTALRDKLFYEILNSIFRNMTTLGTGVILLVGGAALQDGSFTVGDFSLFVFYLGFVTDLTARIGTFFARFKQMGVALARMDKLMGESAPEALVAPTPTYLSGDLPEVPYVSKGDEHHLERLVVRDLRYRYPESGGGVEGASFEMERGSFTVVTGRVGSGKTTLLRGVLGLLPTQR